MSKYKFVLQERKSKRTHYDGLYLRNGQLHLSARVPDFMYDKVNVYHDTENNAIRIENDPNGVYEVRKGKTTRWINCPRMPLPLGRYLRQKVDTNGGIFVLEQSTQSQSTKQERE